MNGHPVQFSVEYPERDLNRLTTALRIFTAIPILIVLCSIAGYSAQYGAGSESATVAVGGTGLLVLPPPLLMIVFRQKYHPRGLFDYVEGVMRWHNRVVAYAFVLVTDDYPPFRLGQ